MPISLSGWRRARGPPADREERHSARIGTIERSWNSRMAKERWPWGLEVAALLEHLQRDRGGRQRQRHADDDGAPQHEPLATAAAAKTRPSGRLRRAEPEDVAAHRDQPRQLELEPDDEEQEHDAELGDAADGLGLADERQAGRADDDAGGEVAEDAGGRGAGTAARRSPPRRRRSAPAAGSSHARQDLACLRNTRRARPLQTGALLEAGNGRGASTSPRPSCSHMRLALGMP